MRFAWWTLASAAVTLAAPQGQNPSPSSSGTPTTSSGTPTAPATPGGTPAGDACGQILPKADQYVQANPKASAQVPAQMAYDCLQTVPNKPGPAKDLIKSLKAYVQWQSTLTWLKNPPGSYMLPPTDIEGGLDDIGKKAEAGQYKSEYDFQLAIFELVESAHDGHFSFRGDVFKGFAFRNKLASDIVSVSRDGVEVPKLYHLSQLDKNESAPAIIRINGRDAATLIEDLNSKYSGYQDPDSQWNSNFMNYAVNETSLTVAASLAYQGSKVTLAYDNGEERSEDSYALIRHDANFNGIHNGEDYYNKFCNPDTEPKPSSTSSATPSATSGAPSQTTNPNMPKKPKPALPPPPPTISGYPWPIVRDSGANATSGYFLNGTGYDDVAVLAVSSFGPPDSIDGADYLTNFQSTVATFLAKSKAEKKKRLVIDVTANGGGYVVAGYELFAQLYPDVNRFQADNLRLSEALVNLARLTAAIPDNFTASTPEEKNAIEALSGSSVVSNLIPGDVYTPQQQLFTTVDQLLAPVSLNGDSFTAYQSTPLNETDMQFNLTGVGNKANPPGRYFEPENVVLFTDGTCGSTCTIFSYLLILQMGIKTTVVGGRPKTGIMQSIAGVEGAQVFSFSDIQSDSKAILALTPREKRDEVAKGELGELAKGYALKRSTTPKSGGSVNAKNAFSMSDARTPLQFLWEPANCRIFYTHEMLFRPETTWKRVVDATWSNPAEFCVEGSQTPVNKSTKLDPFFHESESNTGLPGWKSAAAEGVSGAGTRLAALVAAFAVTLLIL